MAYFATYARSGSGEICQVPREFTYLGLIFPFSRVISMILASIMMDYSACVDSLFPYRGQ